VNCDVCGTLCAKGAAPWHFACPSCATEYSTLAPRINDASFAARIDESQRAKGLRAVRAESYRNILDSLTRLPGVQHRRRLEVGSAHGWFLEAAADRFDTVVGIEPDDLVRTQPGNDRVTVRPGFFPDRVGEGETFDVIVFNDVFEHIPQTSAIAKAIASHLAPGGVALISLPVSEGFIYRCSKGLARCGFAEPFKRMWQYGYPSPHLYYFSNRGLIRLFESAGLHLAMTKPLPTLKIDGLWQRIRYGEGSLQMAAASYMAALALAPVLGLLPPDTAAFFFRRGAAQERNIQELVRE
jgi:2-polyprenyl-3-methyl-5-hydroxy-6-metoxy-1,4-benzoquinol methylase